MAVSGGWSNGQGVDCSQLLPALLLEAITEGSQHQLNVGRLGVVAHDTHTPDLPGGGAQAACNLDIVDVHGVLHNCSPVNASWHLNGVDSDQAVLVLLNKGLQAHAAQAIPQLVVQLVVPLPHGLQALLAHNGQGLTHGVPGANQTSVVVAALAEPAPVVTNQVQVQVVCGRGAAALLDLLHSTLTQEQRSSAWWARQALL
mmetsp:Transcript_25690/g.55954  ORF Transcript_25690/g.55954 Transcript_25690/m.55954 type:complete len:201 (-) Transcript_25690:867-1469(-)